MFFWNNNGLLAQIYSLYSTANSILAYIVY